MWLTKLPLTSYYTDWDDPPTLLYGTRKENSRPPLPGIDQYQGFIESLNLDGGKITSLSLIRST